MENIDHNRTHYITEKNKYPLDVSSARKELTALEPAFNTITIIFIEF